MTISYYYRCILIGVACFNLSGVHSKVLLRDNDRAFSVKHEAQTHDISIQKQVQKKITGTITDVFDSPLVGVSVIEKGSTNGTSTDIDGKYTLNVPLGATIQFSMIGFDSKEIKVSETNIYNVTLEENSQLLSDIVVVGYGTQKKVNLTGAVDNITAKELEDRPVSNIAQAIQGKMPNVNITFSGGEPGLGGSINVRGLTSINGGGPLILIDGIPGDMNRINPNDIESISVLKDAAASAIYGARGAFGVILITTKNAKEGKMSISYNGFFASSSPTVSTDFLTNGYESAKLNDEAFLRSKGNTYTRYTEEDYAELEARRYDRTEDPSRPWIVIKNIKGKDIYNYYGNYDWWNTMFTKHQLSHSHNVNITGGNDKLNFMLSGNFYTKEGIMKINKDNFKSYNFRSKISALILPILRLTNNTQYYDKKYEYYGKEGGGNSNFTNITVHALPAYAPFNPDGTSTYNTLKNNYSIGDGSLALLADGNSRGAKGIHEFQTTTGIELKPIKEITVNADYTYSHYIADDWYRATVIKYSIEPGILQDVPNYNTDEYTKTMWFDPMHVANAYANYSDIFGKHNIAITAGMNYESKEHQRLMGSRKNLLSQTLNDLNLGTGDMEVGGGSYKYTLFGAFFRTAYNYNDRYLLEINGRYDGTSRYKKENRFGFFPSFSGAWRISEEQFFGNIKNTIDNLKIRASYGTLGNQLIGSSSTSANYYPYISSLGMGLSNWIMNGNKTQTVSAPSPIAINLTWEKATTTNIGLDFGLLHNRLSFTGDWYIRDTKDMLIPGATLPAVYGASSPKQNAGDLRTKGYEFSIRWSDQLNLGGKPINYEVFASLGDAKSKITKFDNPTKLLTNNYVGKEWGEIWGFKIDGFFNSDEEAAAWNVDQSLFADNVNNASGDWARLRGGDVKFVDIDGDKKITKGKNTLDDHGDLVKVGNSEPRYNYSFGTNLNWNNIDLSAFFQGIGKRNWYPGSNADKYWGPFSRPYYSFLPKDFSNLLWTEDNKDSYFPILRAYTALGATGPLGVPNNRYIQNIGYLRLKSLVVGYSLPNQLIKKIGLQKCRVYLSGENLLTWTPLETDYIDPEQPIADSNGRTYPLSKTISIGLDIKF
ncbi:TonB-dependent receptor [Dysgonomonas sp. Marseille-P4677]|uniref:SusC/RagA family TonB-linked outer membrane protein n=1 Tax=Dysgonomonas sp. Marseille-P4677 TaxID=2364790 RepID=UPI001912FBF0|nr:TonB-dependent receptor [Dysgonomonas sp. Marseille-P4677]MBK5722435.1 TonB-dependent receptor [Dysgonomonas sp. Marseille-P4677]